MRRSKILLYLTIAYIYLPILLFVGGWLRIYTALPVIIICGFYLYRMVRDYLGQEKKQGELLRIIPDWRLVAISILFIAAVCIFAGFGGWFPQAGDWYKHNAVLHDLSEHSWPVVYTEREMTMLTYYVGQYLVPGLIGKITGSFRAAEIAMCIWGITGVVLIYFNLIQAVKADTVKKQLAALWMMFFFCGVLLFAQIVLKQIYGDTMYSMGDYHWITAADIKLQYRSSFVMLRWVFPQCIVPWLTILLFIRYYKKIEYYMLLFLPVLLFSSFSFISFVVMALGMAGFRLVVKRDKKRVLRQCFSLSNILVFASLGMVLFFFFLGNVSVKKPQYLSFGLQHYSLHTIWIYLIFCLFMFGIYMGMVWRENKKNPFFYLALIQLLLIPFFKMGYYNDFVMCTSIPALFLMEIFVLRFLFERTMTGEAGIRKGILIVCLCVGMWYPMIELSQNIMAKQAGNMSADGYGTMAYFADRENKDIQDDLKYNYYTYDLEQSFFYRYLAGR